MIQPVTQNWQCQKGSKVRTEEYSSRGLNYRRMEECIGHVPEPMYSVLRDVYVEMVKLDGMAEALHGWLERADKQMEEICPGVIAEGKPDAKVILNLLMQGKTHLYVRMVGLREYRNGLAERLRATESSLSGLALIIKNAKRRV